MKANELRIGNWFSYKNRPDVKPDRRGSYTEVIADDILYLEENPDCDWVEPIPLTEDWLKKFEMADGIFTANNYFSVARSNVNEKDWGVYCENDFTGEYIQYVHQLQNLYFALTGTELEIKSNQ